MILMTAQYIVNNNKHQGSTKCLKIMGLVSYVAYKWRDKVYLRLNKSCEHIYQYPCKERLLKERVLDRPFISESIRRPLIIDGKFDEYST